MNRSRAKTPSYPPIDWTMAAILERKKIMKLDWSDLASVAGMNSDAFRKMISTKETKDWPREKREKICRHLGINVVSYVVGSPEDPYR